MNQTPLLSNSSLSASFRQSSASKIDQLYEISYVPDDSKIPITQLPMVNPYNIFSKPNTSLSRKVKKLIGSSSSPTSQFVKEYVQASKFDSHQLPATSSEHLVTLSLPPDLPKHCLAQGYTHIHFGAVRLALTFHGRKGLPAFSRIALVDTRFVEYQHACIGTIQTTLNAGTIFVTFYPNFNMPLNDPSLLTALKAQIQIGGVTQVNTFQATFHYQMAYRVQNHSMDLMVPGQENSGDALFLEIDANAQPTCTYVPRQLSRAELLKLLPEKWVTNYEQIHQAPPFSVQTTAAPDFIRHDNGTVEVKFTTSQAATTTPNIFSTVHMIGPAEPEVPTEKHIWYDVCNCQDCLDTAFKVKYDDDLAVKRNSSQKKLKKRYEEGDPSVGLLGEPSGKFDYFVLYSDKKPKPTPPPQPCKPNPPPQISPYYQKALSIIHKEPLLHPSPVPCFMVSNNPKASDYQTEFPPLTPFEHPQQRTRHDWKIKNPTSIGPTGQPTPVTPAEATLNWQSENAIAQNEALKQIISQQDKFAKAQEKLTSRVTSLEDMTAEIRHKIQALHQELLDIAYAPPSTQNSSSLSQKEAEMKSLQNQLQDLERQHKQRRISTVNDLWRLPTTPFVKPAFDPQPMPQPSGPDPSPSLSLWASTPKSKPKPQFKPRPVKPSASVASSSTTTPHPTPYIGDSSKGPAVLPIENANPVSSFLKALTSQTTLTIPSFVGPVATPPSEVDDVFDTSEAFEHLFMTEPNSTVQDDTEPFIDEEAASQTAQQESTDARTNPRQDTKVQFTFDDIPPSKWRERTIEMLTWCTAELQYYTIDMVIKRFIARAQGRLRDWYLSLGEYRQRRTLSAPSPEDFINIIYAEFIGNPVEHTIHAREEFLKMKCCSFLKKDLEKHYNRMSQRFYCLQGVDDVNLKQVFLNSFPESLGNEAYRALEAKNMTVAQTSLGGLYQLILNALEKLCNQKKFFAEFEKTGRYLGSACDDKYLQIKCKDKSSCDCSHGKKKTHSKRFAKANFSDSFKKKGKFSRKVPRKKWKFLKKKSMRGRSSNKCYICHKEGHFARNCPNKKKSQALIQTLNQIEPVDLSDLESLYSLDDEPGDTAVCTIAYSDYSSDSDSDSELSDDYSDIQVLMMSPLPHISSVQKSQPVPLAKVHILTSTYAKPIQVIAFFDTGSSVSILNPKILPSSFWKPHHQTFLAANGESFVIDKISNPVYLRLFPKCVIKHRLLGSSSHGKDLLIGFDILHKLPNLRWTQDGLSYKSFTNPWSPVPRLYMASQPTIESIKTQIIQTSCAQSHTEFLSKHSSPLWLNPSFFVSLPFKQNEDVNPTRASHPGMNPDHYQLALQECNQLVEQDIIEPTSSPWACEAFYVNKRSEQVRGKLRLVINYQPLNHFLADDKFPLPQKKSLFQSLTDAKVLSKFDLKSGFWQLGITPEDRPKTAFCIPDHHYQWKVMPFGLKNAPSAFQKAMVTIFEPILSNALVYIDDILLFSPDEMSHVDLLSRFHSLVHKYGIMLSEKKMEIGVSSIDFLGMKISDGRYQLQPHIAQELHKFPDELQSQKAVQQFLGIVNYMSDFLPKLSKHTVWLFPMLKKNPPPWTIKQTDAVKAIKQLADKIPPLKIPSSSEKRILQTDASDDYWAAILLVQNSDNVRSICGYKSGTFKASEQHYHSTFKEILAVKRGIEKFQFHLVGHEFQVEMDMSSFPRMLEFKKKMLPESQLLRWANWFSQWKFTVKHIKGTANVLADFLSRPDAYKKKCSTQLEAKTRFHPTPSILPMVFPIDKASSSSDQGESSLSPPAVIPVMELPENIAETIADLTLKKRAMPNYQSFLAILLSKYGLFMKGLKFHPDYPYLSIFHIHDLFRLPKEALCFFWYLFESHTIGISFNAIKLLSYVLQCQFKSAPPQSLNLFSLLQWFHPAHYWTSQLSKNRQKYCVILFRRPCSYLPPTSISNQGQAYVYHFPMAFIFDWYEINPASLTSRIRYNERYMAIRSAMAVANNVKPESIPIQVMSDMVAWSDDHPVSEKWIEAYDEWRAKHLITKNDSSDSLEDEYDNDDSYPDPYDDDPSHPDSRWK